MRADKRGPTRSETGHEHYTNSRSTSQDEFTPAYPRRAWGGSGGPFGLTPWMADTFKLSEDPQFVDKVRDVVGLYMNPPEHAVMLCVDEKSSIKHWIGPSRSCRRDPDRCNGARTTTNATVSPICSPR